ncbi:3204_t:CDS:10 [Funneliformis geosporum]|uniref:non-specific serine/threonine protein kinase n=1 Tax=Funneliformis geosporum TaxID=1117311 RepID=A0A9W4SZI7_9GLOM|nr:3204_t:CDS:10 [Funneliformis geosporum]
MVKRSASQILESPINKEVRLSDVNVWGYLISSRGFITLDKSFYMLGNHEGLEENYIHLEGCGEIFFAGIHYDESNGAIIENLCQDGMQRKIKKWDYVALKESFILQDGTILKFKRHQDFEICGSAGSLCEVKNKCFLHKYEFVKRLGGGGFGNVHLARNIYDGQLISKSSLRMVYNAMKELQDLVAREGFHDNQLKNYYLIMDWVEHNSLSTWIQKKGHVNSEAIRSIIKCLVPNLKPENVLVNNENPLSLLFTDFGLSSKLSSNPSDARGTPLLCAPEVLLKSLQNESTDWWSLGHLIFNCYKGGYLLQPIKAGVKELLAEIDHKLLIIKEGKEPVINRMIKEGM